MSVCCTSLFVFPFSSRTPRANYDSEFVFLTFIKCYCILLIIDYYTALFEQYKWHESML